MDTPPTFKLDLKSVLLDKNLSKFGDSIVNFIYNAAVYEVTQESKGVKVWDSCLAQACRDSHLREFIGTKKKSGDIGDAVESFIAYLYIKNKTSLPEMIKILARNIRSKKDLFSSNERDICTESFTNLLNFYCEKIGIEF